MIYVFPHYPKKETQISQIKGISRLFAYPKAPHFNNAGEIVILDSGAFGLSLSGQKMNEKYFINLNRHYLNFHNNKTLCIAPDEFLNPYQSMINFEKWMNLGLFNKITPVLQCSKKYIIEKNELLEQIKFYNKYDISTLCFSNNAITGEMAVNSILPEIISFLKSRLKIKWIHNLGAGWSLKDIDFWRNIEFDSMDSIAYYTTKDKAEFGSLDAIENIKIISNYVQQSVGKD
jgi:hypothetical protein